MSRNRTPSPMRQAAVALGEYIRDEFHPDRRQATELRARVEALITAVREDAMMPRMAIASVIAGIFPATSETQSAK